MNCKYRCERETRVWKRRARNAWTRRVCGYGSTTCEHLSRTVLFDYSMLATIHRNLMFFSCFCFEYGSCVLHFPFRVSSSSGYCVVFLASALNRLMSTRSRILSYLSLFIDNCQISRLMHSNGSYEPSLLPVTKICSITIGPFPSSYNCFPFLSNSYFSTFSLIFLNSVHLIQLRSS